MPLKTRQSIVETLTRSAQRMKEVNDRASALKQVKGMSEPEVLARDITIGNNSPFPKGKSEG